MIIFDIMLRARSLFLRRPRNSQPPTLEEDEKNTLFTNVLLISLIN